MESLEIFKKRMQMTSGKSIRDEHIKNSMQLLHSTFLYDASANPNIVYWKTETNVKCRIFDRKFSSSLGVTAKIQLFIDDVLAVGDIVYDVMEQLYWICTEMFNINDVHKQGKIALCNWTLKFQSPDGTILSYPCIDSNPYNRGGEKEGTVITLGNTEKSITLPCDQNTISLRDGHRFFIDKHPSKPKSFEIIGIDTVSKNYGSKGLIELKVKETEMQKDDKVELGICNYFESTTSPTLPPEFEGYSIITCSNSRNEISVGGSYRILTPTFYNSDGTIIDWVIAVWNINYNGINESDFTLEYINNQIKIKIKENYQLIGNFFTVSVSNVDGEYRGDIIIKITS